MGTTSTARRSLLAIVLLVMIVGLQNYRLSSTVVISNTQSAAAVLLGGGAAETTTPTTATSTTKSVTKSKPSLSQLPGSSSSSSKRKQEKQKENKKSYPPQQKNKASFASSLTSKQQWKQQKQQQQQQQHRVAGLSCTQYGGPPNDIAQEMIYWKDIPLDTKHQSPSVRRRQQQQQHTNRKKNTAAAAVPPPPPPPQYITFEPDEGGWNNIRMALETTIVLAMAMGRIIVLPPEQKMYLLWHPTKQEKDPKLNFYHFYHLSSIQQEYAADAAAATAADSVLDTTTTMSQQNKVGDGSSSSLLLLPSVQIISFEEFLLRKAMTGQLYEVQQPSSTTMNTTITATIKQRRVPSFPPNNRTQWDGQLINWQSARDGVGRTLWGWLRNVTTKLDWHYDQCIAAFPAYDDHPINKTDTTMTAVQRMNQHLNEVLETDKKHWPNTKAHHERWHKRVDTYNDHPTPVNASTVERLGEILAHRKQLCVYNEQLQKSSVIHIRGQEGGGTDGVRFLIPFYAFVFMEDYKDELWLKRFVRDHLRYIDEIQCAAARIVHAVRQYAISMDKTNNPTGSYDSFHIRRGDFQYHEMKLSAEEIYYNNTRQMISDNRTVFVATDEKDEKFFIPLRRHYHLVFLKDYLHLIKDVNPNYYGMIDQLVASRGDTFVGAYLSTFTGYINRLRGYHTQKNDQLRQKHPKGFINSYYYYTDQSPPIRKYMRTYRSVRAGFWQQEWAASWYDIDHNV